MWIVRVALERPYTFIVLSLLILIFGTLSIVNTPKDIFPTINIPIISVVWNYTGLPPDEMANRITSNFERAVAFAANDLEHDESQSLSGVSVTKIFFQPGSNINIAMAQITAVAQTMLRSLPPGTTPPLVLNYNASTVPIIQLAMSSSKESEQELFDYSNNFIRTELATVRGAIMPYPYGGKSREVVVDLDQNKMAALGISAADVNNALGAQNIILPSGTEKIGTYEYNIRLNASPQQIEELNSLPIKAINGTTIYIRDVAHVHDGYAPQTNIVRMDGHRSVLMTILKTGTASTLDVIGNIRHLLPKIRSEIPASIDLQAIGDQSLFVRAAISGVLREGTIAAILTGLMILLFLGSGRSTLIIVISIPLSILTSLIILSVMGESINIMTLGGLALAVGILVDDATVAIENINWHLEQGKEVKQAILDGAQQIAVPALVSTLCICIVFVPMFSLTGVSHYLFIPMAEAVIFAMLASYILSRTLVPTLAMYWLKQHEAGCAHAEGRLGQIQIRFEHYFERIRERYHAQLQEVLVNPKRFIMLFLAAIGVSIVALTPWLGENFFPQIDSGQIKMHVRAHAGTRVEEMARICDGVDSIIRRTIPKDELHRIVDNIGLPISGTNLSYSNSAPVGSWDADIQIALNHGHHPINMYIRQIRDTMAKEMPDIEISFLPADISSQILNFGLPMPIDVQIAGFNRENSVKYANELYGRLVHVAGLSDLHIHQTDDDPEFDVNVDRTRAQELGFTERDIATDLLVSLSGSFQTSPTFWLNPKNGVSYNIVTQTPQYDLESLDDLRNIPISGSLGAKPQILGSVAQIRRASGSTVISHYNVQNVIDIFANAQDRDLGSIASDINKILNDTAKDLPRGTHVVMRGQIETMQQSYHGLYRGFVFAIILVYLLIVVNFQSWTDPFIIITALPAAIAGIVWMLFLTHTTLSVPALTGAIMCMGVATANSILVVSFAREQMNRGHSAFEAALQAGFVRLRPVIMTALAMIIGMVPMALGLGEGGEQNAPLGRAVIGGLGFATVATLFFVPAVFCLIHGRVSSPQPSLRTDPSYAHE